MDSTAGWKHRRMGTKVATAVVGASIAMAAAACSGASGNPSTTPTTTAPPTANPPAKTGHAPGVVGQITAENGSTWTVSASDATSYTVTITPQTQFGTRRTPGTAQQFPVGTTVRISGTASGNTITASRITTARPRHPASTAPASPPG